MTLFTIKGAGMEFSINKTTFSEALSLVTSVVPERSARAIMQNLMLTGNSDNTITLSATDLEIGLKITLDVQDMKDPVSVLLPGSRLNALIKGTYADEVHISIVDNIAEIKTGKGRFQVPGADILDYPSIPDFKPEGAVFIHGDDFVEAVQKTVFATAKGDTRYALNGIYVSVNENGADFVASDTHRLSLIKKKIRNPDNSVFDGIILTKGMTTLSRLASGSDIVEINITANELQAKTANASLIIRKVEGMFPRYNDVIPAKSDSCVVVDREELMRGLHSIGLMTSDETKAVSFGVNEGFLEISASSENGEGTIRLDAETHGGAIDIKFNYTFLIDVLKNIGEDTVNIQYKDADNPARIDSGDFLYVIMPINR